MNVEVYRRSLPAAIAQHLLSDANLVIGDSEMVEEETMFQVAGWSWMSDEANPEILPREPKQMQSDLFSSQDHTTRQIFESVPLCFLSCASFWDVAWNYLVLAIPCPDFCNF
jgi:hypothetical protein